MIPDIALNRASFEHISTVNRRTPRLARRDIDRSALRAHRGFLIVGADASLDLLSWVRR
jgi:hypothetical protein